MFELRKRWQRVALQLVISLAVVPFLIPLISMVRGSLGGQGFENYRIVIETPGVPSFFMSSAIIAAGAIGFTYVCSMAAAFAFAKIPFAGRELFFWMMLACLALPEAVLLTPLFTTILKLGLFNTYSSVILPIAALNIPFSVLMARTYMASIPNELFEAARVDGCSTFRTFLQIVLPLARPIGAVVVVWTLIGAWNDYLFPLVFLQSPSKQTITLLPSYFQSQFGPDLPKILTAAVITAVPEIVAYLLLQRLFERGLTAGAIK
jgi:raffinose/stachyose/melibiose transport system permease protein